MRNLRQWWLGSLTTITVTGILSNGIHLVFLPAGDQTCTNAALARVAQSGGRITNGAISVHLATNGLYKTCFSTLANPSLDAQFTYLTATQLFCRQRISATSAEAAAARRRSWTTRGAPRTAP